MTIIYVLLLLGAAISFGLSAAQWPRESRLNLLGLGLLLWVLVPLLQNIRVLD